MPGHSENVCNTVHHLYAGRLPKSVVDEVLRLEPEDVQLVTDILWDLLDQVRADNPLVAI